MTECVIWFTVHLPVFWRLCKLYVGFVGESFLHELNGAKMSLGTFYRKEIKLQLSSYSNFKGSYLSFVGMGVRSEHQVLCVRWVRW